MAGVLRGLPREREWRHRPHPRARSVQRRDREAAALLDRAGASGAAQLCSARRAFDEGDTLRCAELLERLLRQLPVERRVDRVPALELMVRARASRGELHEAGSALDSLRELERLVGTD